MGGRVFDNPHFLIETLFSREGGTKCFNYCCSINLKFLKGKTMIWYQIYIGLSHFFASIRGGSKIKFTVSIWKGHKMAIWDMFLPQLWEGIEYNFNVPIYNTMAALNYKCYLSTLHEWVGGVNQIQIVPKIYCLKQAVGWGV